MPWIASWFPPLHPGGSFGWMPEMPNANVPREPPRERRCGRSRSTRRVASATPARPWRAGMPKSTRSNFVTVMRCSREVDVDLDDGRASGEAAQRDPALTPWPDVGDLDATPPTVGRDLLDPGGDRHVVVLRSARHRADDARAAGLGGRAPRGRVARARAGASSARRAAARSERRRARDRDGSAPRFPPSPRPCRRRRTAPDRPRSRRLAGRGRPAAAPATPVSPDAMGEAIARATAIGGRHPRRAHGCGCACPPIGGSPDASEDAPARRRVGPRIAAIGWSKERFHRSEPE